MSDNRKRRAALLAGVSVAMLAALLPAQAEDVRYDALSNIGSAQAPSKARLALAARRKADKKADAKTDKAVRPAPPGQLHVIVSIDRQRATLFANGAPVASTPVSTGTKSHPTPMGLFTVIQKNRHHVSNLYNAAMPYMQRITWSGSAMHQGPLPGYPASHGCIRLTTEFAAMLWKATKIGVRVIVTRPEVAPVEFQHAKLFSPKPKVAATAPTAALIKTAEALNIPGAVAQDGTPEKITAAPQSTPAMVPEQLPPGETIAVAPAATPAEITGSTPALRPAIATAAPAKAEEAPKVTAAATALPDERWTATEAAAGYKDIERRTSPVSVFVSRKDQKLYVRQGMEPVFDVPVKILNPQQPIGTHVYTAMEVKDDTAMRWTSVTIPSGYARDMSVTTKRGKNGKLITVHPPKQDFDPTQPASNASGALDRLDLPADAVERITAMMIPGSSLVVSDNGISHETGNYTDFIILTR